MVLALGVGGLQVDQHPEDGCQQLIQPCLRRQGEASQPFLQTASSLHCRGWSQRWLLSYDRLGLSHPNIGRICEMTDAGAHVLHKSNSLQCARRQA